MLPRPEAGMFLLHLNLHNLSILLLPRRNALLRLLPPLRRAAAAAPAAARCRAAAAGGGGGGVGVAVGGCGAVSDKSPQVLQHLPHRVQVQDLFQVLQGASRIAACTKHTLSTPAVHTVACRQQHAPRPPNSTHTHICKHTQEQAATRNSHATLHGTRACSRGKRRAGQRRTLFSAHSSAQVGLSGRAVSSCSHASWRACRLQRARGGKAREARGRRQHSRASPGAGDALLGALCLGEWVRHSLLVERIGGSLPKRSLSKQGSPQRLELRPSNIAPAQPRHGLEAGSHGVGGGCARSKRPGPNGGGGDRQSCERCPPLQELGAPVHPARAGPQDLADQGLRGREPSARCRGF